MYSSKSATVLTCGTVSTSNVQELCTLEEHSTIKQVDCLPNVVDEYNELKKVREAYITRYISLVIFTVGSTGSVNVRRNVLRSYNTERYSDT